MWCVDCQQDVPAVARSARESLVCPRCQGELEQHASLAASPSDVGIALDSLDQTSVDVEQELASPRDWFKQSETCERLRKIDRTLRSPYRPADAISANTTLQRSWPKLPVPPVDVPLQSVPRLTAAKARSTGKPTKTSWFLSLLLSSGVLGFGAGLGLLGWSAMFRLPQLWQPGMTLTIGAEGLLILSLTWMAARLWGNGRNINRQLHGVDRQLAEIEQITGTLAGSQQSSSQHFYHHFNQATSPHMQVANLQGQMDSMSARLSSEG